MRLMGKRQLGELEPSEFAVTVMISELASIPLQDIDIPLLHGILPILVIVSLEFIMSYLSLRSLRFRALTCGKPSILIADGKIDQHEMSKTRLSLDELMSALRVNGTTDISSVRYAILEPGGQLSVIPYERSSPATPSQLSKDVNEPGIPFVLINDGRFVASNLKKRGLDKVWVENWLKRNGKPRSRDIFLLTLDDCGNFYCAARDNK